MAIKGVLFDFDGTLTVPGALDFPSIKRMLGCPLDHPILEFIAVQPVECRPGLLRILEEQEDLAAENSLPEPRCRDLPSGPQTQTTAHGHFDQEPVEADSNIP